MKKIHTRVKRKFQLSTKFKHYFFFHPKVTVAHRPRSFNTEAAAHSWAEKQGLKKEQYTLKKVKHDKKFQIVMAADAE